jgi:hypothetical protein
MYKSEPFSADGGPTVHADINCAGRGSAGCHWTDVPVCV